MADPLIRKLRILQMLPREEDGGITVEEILDRLFEEYGIDEIPRNVQRDLRSLQGTNTDPGFPISCDEEQPKPWRWSWYGKEAIGIPKMGRHTALTFQMVEEILQPLLPAESRKLLEPNFKAAKEILNKGSEKKTRKWREKIRIINSALHRIPPPIGKGVLETISQALFDEKQIELAYLARSNTTGRPRMYTVNPFALLYRDCTIELLGRIDGDQTNRRWPLHRVRSVSMNNTPSSVPATFNLDHYLKTELGFPGSGKEMKLQAWFRKDAAFHVQERPLSRDQTEMEAENGIIVTATVRHTVELKWWILGLGDRVQVLGPKALLDDIRHSIESTANLYR